MFGVKLKRGSATSMSPTATASPHEQLKVTNFCDFRLFHAAPITLIFRRLLVAHSDGVRGTSLGVESGARRVVWGDWNAKFRRRYTPPPSASMAPGQCRFAVPIPNAIAASAGANRKTRMLRHLRTIKETPSPNERGDQRQCDEDAHSDVNGGSTEDPCKQNGANEHWEHQKRANSKQNHRENDGPGDPCFGLWGELFGGLLVSSAYGTRRTQGLSRPRSNARATASARSVASSFFRSAATCALAVCIDTWSSAPISALERPLRTY